MPVKKRKTRKKAAARKGTTGGRLNAKKKTVSAKTPIRAPLNKSQLMAHIADVAELNRKQVSAVFEELSHLMHRHLCKGGAGEFTVPGLLKCVVKNKPATKARRGINPFTGEMTTFKAKPARNVVKIRGLKRLKEMAA